MEDTFDIDGHLIQLWHKGRQSCTICDAKGHSDRGRDRVEAQQRRNRKRREAYRARQQDNA